MNACQTTPAACFLTTGLSRSAGGPFFSVSGLAKAVNDTGAAAVVVVGCYRSCSGWEADASQWRDAPLVASPYRGLWSARDLYRAAARTISQRNGRPGIVHLHGLWDVASIAAFCLARRTPATIVVSPRGMLEPWALGQSRLKKRSAWLGWQRTVMMRAALLHATSHEEYLQLRRLGLRNPVAVIPNGLEAPAGLSRRTARPSGADPVKRCLFLSRLHPKKGLPMLLQAWAELRPADWRLHIAGDGDPRYVQELKDLAGRLGIDARFEGELTGEDKWRFLASGSLFVLPTYSENFGIAVAEAMVAGLPVITTTGAPWKILGSQRMGWCVPPTPETIREAVREAISLTDEQRTNMGVRGQAYARAEFGWPAIGQRMADCYRWLCGDGTCPADVLLN